MRRAIEDHRPERFVPPAPFPAAPVPNAMTDDEITLPFRIVCERPSRHSTEVETPESETRRDPSTGKPLHH